MKLRELKVLQDVQESFVPIETVMALDSLRKGEDDNMSHKFILAQVVNYAKDHPVTAERYRDINEFRPSLEMLDAVKALAKKDLAELAEWAYEIIQNALKGIDQEGYTNPDQTVHDYIRWASHRQK